MKKLLLVSIVAGLASVAAQAATPATTTFQVTMTITAACSVVAASDISLGSVDATATNVSSSNIIKVTCSKSTPYNIGLAPSNGNADGAGFMKLNGTGTSADETVAYQLRSASAAGSVWGNTATAGSIGNGVHGTGTGAAQDHAVFAVAPSANSTPGHYTDIVTVTVNY